MSPPAAVYVVVAVVGAAAIYAFKELVYEPHLAPTLESWAEDFLERRRAARNRRASAVPVRASRRRDSPSSSVSSFHDDDNQRDGGDGDRAHGPNANDFPVDGFELEALASKEVDEWRNEVLRSQGRTKDGLRKRRTNQLRDEFDSFDIMSSTIEESFTSLTYTPLASTHVISNLSSPITPSTVSLPQTPTHLRSESRSTARDATVSFAAPRSPVHEMPAIPPKEGSPGPTGQTPRAPTDVGNASPPPIATSIADYLSPATEGAPHPLPFTPTYQVVADDSPFGPLLPDTPRSSAEIYGERPFSPITRVMGSSSGHASAAGSKGTLSSRANSASSVRTLGSSGVLRKPSALANEVVVNGSDGGNNEDHAYTSPSAFTLTHEGPGMNGSVISSLSERYPIAPTPPVIVSPPASSIGVISAPSSPRSGRSEAMMHHDVIAAEQHFAPQTHTSLPLLQLPPDSLGPRLMSRAPSSAHSGMSPALSYASFLSPMPLSRAASESEGDEFLSIASDDSDWGISPVTPGGRTGPMHDRLNNPFLNFEHLTHVARANSSEHGDGSEGSEVLVADLGQEGASEVGSEESWGSARRH